MTFQTLIHLNIEITLIILCLVIWIWITAWNADNKGAFRHIWTIDLLTVGLLLSDVFAIYYRGNETKIGFYMVHISNFVCFCFLYSISFYSGFIVELLFENSICGKKRILISKIISVGAIVANIINVFIPFMYDFDEHNNYFRKPGWYGISFFSLIALLLLATVIWQCKSDVEPLLFWILFVDILMPFIASIVQVFIYGIAITTIAIGITQILLFLIMFRYQEMKIKERDIQLSEYNARLMLTQVKPHFMLNTLSTIQYLCKTDSQAAVDTITDFGIYLRNNMEFASTSELIPFEKELSHIEKYVSIEHKRFGDRIKVTYDINEKDFDLPPLTIQPLIENAIKHGISKKRGGGTVNLSTWKEQDKIHIVVKDDGVGFDMNQPFSDERVHIGLSIVTERIESMCNGKVSLNSILGEGVTCEIIIPIDFS